MPRKAEPGIYTSHAVRTSTAFAINPALYAERKRGWKVSAERTATATALATLIASGAGTAMENIQPDLLPNVPILVSQIDTRHTVTVLGDATKEHADLIADIPVGSEVQGVNTYSVPIDLSDVDRLNVPEEQIILEEIAQGTINRLNDEMTATQTRNALNEALKANDIDINVDSLIINANQIIISSEQKQQLTEIAAKLGYSDIENLIADYATGAIHEDDSDRPALDEILRNNIQTTIDLELQSGDLGNLRATIYRTDDGYMIVVNDYEHSEEQGVVFSLVIIPVPLILLRRRTYSEQRDHELDTYIKAVRKQSNKDFKDFQKRVRRDAKASKISHRHVEPGSMTQSNGRYQSVIKDSQIPVATVVEPNRSYQVFEASNGTRVNGGGGEGTFVPSSESPIVDTEAEVVPELIPEVPTTPVVAEELQPVIELAVEEPTVIEPETTPDTHSEKEEFVVEDESTPEEKEKRRRLKLRLAKWIICIGAVTSVLHSDASDTGKGHGVPDPAQTTLSQPGKAYSEGHDGIKEIGKQKGDNQEQGDGNDSTGDHVDVVVPKPPEVGAIVLTYKDGELTGASLSGTRQDDLTVIDRVVPPVEPPVPPVEVIRGHYDWNIPSGGTGEGLMETLGLDPATWYQISPGLLNTFPTLFYGDPAAARIMNAGDLPDPVKDYIIRALDLK